MSYFVEKGLESLNVFKNQTRREIDELVGKLKIGHRGALRSLYESQVGLFDFFDDDDIYTYIQKYIHK